ncbi:hypothetical protein KKE60_01585 [Patescibacteria group bacterium]|nr:hypothetical protein [Patescibacteria group bacterium]MBU0922789.1 hypothetical protein [Patescibacteria group bacterium]MBU1066477.1 hypothetical protein [Patescibacteria group bacterium]MBU1844413.1 hypothetical protein [Patescibacteria group bacterium]
MTYKLGLIAAGILTTGLIAAGTASAASGNGFGFDRMFSNKAEVLGMSVEDLKSQLGEKTFLEIAEEQGISHEALQENMKVRAQERMEEMGLSDEDIARRLQFRAERQVNCDESGPLMNGEGNGGFGRNGSEKGFGQRLAE